MAPQAKLEETVPSTLPDNFESWDGEESQPPATLPDDFDAFDETADGDVEEPAPSTPAVLPAASKALDNTAARAAIAPATSPAIKPVPVAKPAASRAPEAKAKRQPAPAQAKAAEVVVPQKQRVAKAEPKVAEPKLVEPKVVEPEEEEPSKGKSPMMMIIGAVVLVAVILAVAIPMMLRKAPAKTAQVPAPQQVVSYTPEAPPSAVAAGTPPQTKPTAAAPLQTTAGTPATTAPAAQTPSVQPDVMNSLNAPSRISGDIKSPQKDAAPPPTSFGAGGMEGLGGGSGAGVGTVFSGQSGPKVKIATPRFVTISSGVAQGMLIQRTTPVYPPIAKTARVAGTVVLEATISKNGMVEGLRVVSGPEMLRQSAVDAVRSWRYKPYKLNNEPVEVETTVSVVFSLGG